MLSNESSIYWNGYKYRKNAERRNHVYYVCSAARSTKCKATIQMNEDNLRSNAKEHTCGKQIIAVRNFDAVSELIDRRMENYARDYRLSAKQVYERLLLEVHEEIGDAFIPPKKQT